MKNQIKYNINILKNFAKLKEGDCLSNKFYGIKEKHIWKCKNNHIWNASIDMIIYRKHWCNICNLEEKRIQRYNRLNQKAEKFGGKLLSTLDELSSYKKIRFECKLGHKWNAPNYEDKNNTWCPVCYNKQRGQNRIKYNKEKLEQHAIKYNGHFLSKEVRGMNNKYLWQCSEGHKWKGSITNVVYNGTWCKICSNKKYINENICRQIFEKTFNLTFPNKHPKCLNGLELDGYNEKIGIAFEYNGEQHYYPIKMIKNKLIKNNILEKTKERDNKKIELCKNNNIKLIVVPYWIKEKEKFIIEKCRELEII